MCSKSQGGIATIPDKVFLFLWSFVDNHACILLSIKNTLWILKRKVTTVWKWPRKVTTVPLPQQARTGGELVVHRTGSEQESSRDTPIITTTTTEQAAYYYYYYCGTDRLLQLLLRLRNKPPTTTTTTTGVEIISTFRTRKIREVSFSELIILYKEYPPSEPHISHIIIIKYSAIVPE
jgi:hypothetical protein